MYLPAMGVTNIYGGEVTGAQGIRICAGELNMTGGTLTAVSYTHLETVKNPSGRELNSWC